MQPNWHPFRVDSSIVLPPRPIGTKDGIGDRLRAASFAEVQALTGFRWAAERFEDASLELRADWLRLALEEEKHLGWLKGRMDELGIDLRERPVSDFLWRSFMKCASAREFCHYIAGAEERGRAAGLRFGERMKAFDSVSAEIFRKIADEELSHIELAYRYYPRDYPTNDKNGPFRSRSMSLSVN